MKWRICRPWALLLFIALLACDDTASGTPTPDAGAPSILEGTALSDADQVGRFGPLDQLVILNELLLTVDLAAPDDAIQALAESLSTRVVGRLPQVGLWQLRFDNPTGDGVALAERLGLAAASSVVAAALLLRIQVSSSKKWSRRPTDRVPLGA